ncbi:Thioesterase/thiol ester dehydrase-isomerase [Rhizodiscina lignyota]|uniref:Thioesterase/thiol ester dehydrase-isomerase n=1 Tax=Rhizodiscina lignyota TaxID=1504668 RepID=A0A9P4IKY7_9PEZI|nr:Thioesterase/thiol ester dehydrase-isomerase [Rhizodiscina lignyota]
MAQSLGVDLTSKRKRKRSDYPYHEDYRTRWNDNDMFHHINNPVYGVLIDSIINSYLITKCGYSTAESKYIGLVANTYCDYFGSAQYPGMLDIGLRVVKMGKSSVMYEVGIFQEGSEQVKAVGGFIQIWVERATNKVTDEGVPAWIKEPLQRLLKGGEQDPDRSKL